MKYKLTENFIIRGNKKLYQIQSLKNFSNVEVGDLGGYIESEKNLSQEGDCWILDNAIVYGKAFVYGNAQVYGSAKVFGSAEVFDNAEVSGNAKINDKINELSNYRYV